MVRDPRLLVLAAVGAFALAGCPKNVPQDSKSGEDSSYKGAKEIKLEESEVKSRGIVTYPGGDRVDWKVIELPKDKQGTLKVTLRWVPPRPGLDLSFEVYNEWNHVVQSAKPNKKKRSRKTTKTVTLENAKGKYFIQVYASERGDAGKYTLHVEFAEQQRGDPFDWLKVEISDPPKLAAVPEAAKPCEPFDKKNPSCASVCPSPPDPAWPPCAGKCPVPPDPAIASCLETMPCPTPAEKADKKFKMCTKDDFVPCNAAMTDAEKAKNLTCVGWQAPGVIAEITDIQEAEGGGVVITIGAGTKSGVNKGWKGVLLDDNRVPIKGTEFVVSRATKDASVGKVKVDRDSISPTTRVSLKSK